MWCAAGGRICFVPNQQSSAEPAAAAEREAAEERSGEVRAAVWGRRLSDQNGPALRGRALAEGYGNAEELGDVGRGAS